MMQYKYTFAAIILLVSFNYCAAIAYTSSLKDDGEELKGKPQSAMKIISSINLNQLPDFLTERKPTKAEIVGEIIKTSDYRTWPQVRFFPIDDSSLSKNMSDLLTDGRWEY